MDVFKKAAASVSNAASSVVDAADRSIREKAREQAERQLETGAEARRRAGAMMAPSATTTTPASAYAGRPGAPDLSAGQPSTPSSGRRRPASPDARGGAGATPASAIADLYGDLDELRRAALATPGTPHPGGNTLDVSALADMLRIDIVTRRVFACVRCVLPCVRLRGCLCVR
jgi:hypothetical protein